MFSNRVTSMGCMHSGLMMMGRDSSSGKLLVRGRRYTFDGQGGSYGECHVSYKI